MKKGIIISLTVVAYVFCFFSTATAQSFDEVWERQAQQMNAQCEQNSNAMNAQFEKNAQKMNNKFEQNSYSMNDQYEKECQNMDKKIEQKLRKWENKEQKNGQIYSYTYQNISMEDYTGNWELYQENKRTFLKIRFKHPKKATLHNIEQGKNDVKAKILHLFNAGKLSKISHVLYTEKNIGYNLEYLIANLTDMLIDGDPVKFK